MATSRMTGYHRYRSAGRSVPDRNVTGVERKERKRRRKDLERRNEWFALLRGAAAEDLERRGQLPKLRPSRILQWADAYHARTGEWPTWGSGPIPEAPGETWLAVEAALSLGSRGFPGRSTLVRFLDEHRGRYNPKSAHFTIKQILRWMDDWHARTGRWPDGKSGRIPDTQGVTWAAVEHALAKGRGGLPGGSSLAALRAEKRGVPRRQDRPGLTEATVLRWADAHHRRTRRWPGQGSGPIPGAAGENWLAVDNALRVGLRGLPGGSSLRQLLSRERGVRNEKDLPPLDIAQILRCADAHHERFGEWPMRNSGPVADAPGETWLGINGALWRGNRGLRGGSSLARLLAARRGVRNKQSLPQLTVRRILRWADAHHARTGQWPDGRSGPIPEAPGETWLAVETALSKGGRGLPGGSSLVRLLIKNRGASKRSRRSRLAIARILAWADAFHERTGHWPTRKSGAVTEEPGETWWALDSALHAGSRGLPGGSTLTRLLAARRGLRNKANLPPLNLSQVLRWADQFHARAGRWPTANDGEILGTGGETWMAVDVALQRGKRGLPAKSSLALLLAKERGVRTMKHLPRFSIRQILVWARAHHRRTGKWPTRSSGPIHEASGETWARVYIALYQGSRGLPGGTTLPRLLRDEVCSR